MIPIGEFNNITQLETQKKLHDNKFEAKVKDKMARIIIWVIRALSPAFIVFIWYYLYLIATFGNSLITRNMENLIIAVVNGAGWILFYFESRQNSKKGNN